MKKEIIKIRTEEDFPDQNEHNIYVDLSKYEYRWLETVTTSKVLHFTGDGSVSRGGEIIYTGDGCLFEDNELKGLEYVPGLLTQWSPSDSIFLGHRYLF